MNDQEKVDLLNSMPVIDVDAGGGELVYVLVEYNNSNLAKLAKVVPHLADYMKDMGDPDNYKDSIDISSAAFIHAGADYYHQREGFAIYTKSQLLDMLEEERQKRMAAEAKLKRIEREVIT